MKRFDCEQLSPEWFELHRGRPTASRMDRIMTPKKGDLSAAADELILELIAEKQFDGPIEQMGRPTSPPMQHGIDTEAEARRFYEAFSNHTVEKCGFMMTDDERFGCSPDGIVTTAEGLVGGLELKCPTGKVHGKYRLDGTLPNDYKIQVHGCLLVSGLAFWDFVSYCRGYPPFTVRVKPDDFTIRLKIILDEFWARYQELTAKVLGVVA